MLSADRYKYKEDLEFMDDVEAAMQFRGHAWVYWFTSGLVAFFCFFLLWAAFSSRNEVTRGQGQIIPSLGVQPVQAPEGGVISGIFVKENQLVAKGQKLASISNVAALADYSELQNRRIEYELTLKRLTAEELLQELQFTEAEIKTYPKVVADQLQLFRARREQFTQEGKELAAQLAQKRLELEEALERKKQFDQSLVLLKQQEEKIRPLIQSRSYSDIDFINLQQRIVAQTGELNGLAQTISRIRSAVEETESRLNNRSSERQVSIAGDIQNYNVELGSVTEKLKAGDYRVQSADLLAPMAGTIKRILLKEEGVAQRAEMVMELVPADDALEVDARFRPQDRGYLSEGQKATIMVTAYDYAIYGGLEAEVVTISPDTIEDAKGEPWYNVRLRTKTSKLPYQEKDLRIEAGMTVTVDVLSGEKSVLTYLLKPVFKTQQRSAAVGTPTPGGTVPAQKDPL